MNKKQKRKEHRAEVRRKREFEKRKRRKTTQTKQKPIQVKSKTTQKPKVAVKPEPPKESVQAEPIKQETINMPKRMLLLLNPEKKYHRVARRFLVVFALAGVVAIGNDALVNYGHYISSVWYPVIVALLVALDKLLREIKESPVEKTS